MVASIRYMPALAQSAPGRLADEHPEHVGVPVRVGRARAGPDRQHGAGRCGSPGRRQRGEQRGAGGRAQFHRCRMRAQRGGGVGEHPQHRWHRNRDGAVGRPHRARARGHRRYHPGARLQQAEGMQRERAPGHVGDGVERPDLVEADLVGRDAVDVGLRAGQPAEHGDREVPRPVGQAARDRIETTPDRLRVASLSGASTTTWAALKPCRRTAFSVTPTGSTSIPRSPARTASRSAPASSRAASSMSPAAPLLASTQSVFTGPPRWPAPPGAPGRPRPPGRSARRPPRPRTRCRR